MNGILQILLITFAIGIPTIGITVWVIYDLDVKSNTIVAVLKGTIVEHVLRDGTTTCILKIETMDIFVNNINYKVNQTIVFPYDSRGRVYVCSDLINDTIITPVWKNGDIVRKDNWLDKLKEKEDYLIE